MRAAWERFPGDGDIGALYAESMMDLRPWALWAPDGKPEPGTEGTEIPLVGIPDTGTTPVPR